MPRAALEPWISLSGHKSLKGRAGHTATLVDKKLYILGGRNGNEFFNDLWVFDVDSGIWTCLQKHVPFEARAYHSATLMNGNQIWVIGGSDHLKMYGDVHVLNLETLEWTCAETRGELAGRLRGTHAALQHPVRKTVILVYGGYSGDSWLSDLCTLRTDNLSWETVRCRGGIAPDGRGYHTFTPFGTQIILFGGKGEHGIVPADEISVYDVESNAWITPRVKGVAPLSRSNHAAVLFDSNLIVIHGGRHAGSRLDDFCLLRIVSSESSEVLDSLEWEYVEQDKDREKLKFSRKKDQQTVAEAAAHGPGGRSAHAMCAIGGSLYLVGGYGGGGYTFSDIFVIPEFSRVVETLTGAKSPSRSRSRGTKKSQRRSLDVVPDSPRDEGWRSTKQPKRAPKRVMEAGPSIPVLVVESDENTSGSHLGITEPAVEAPNQTINEERAHPFNVCGGESHARPEALSILQERANALAANELHQKELAHLQHVVDSLKAELHGKNLLELELRSGKSALEDNIILLRKQVDEANRTTMELQSKLEKSKSDAQDTAIQLDDKKKEVFDLTHQLRSSDVKVAELSRSLQQLTNSQTSISQELTMSKQTVKQLQTEVEKKMEEIQQLRTTQETERASLNKEVAEKRTQIETLTNKLEASKTLGRNLQDTVDRLVKRTERDSAKIDVLQKDQGDLTAKFMEIRSERDQLVAKADRAEANAELVKEELRVARNAVERNAVEIGRLKENADQAKEHIGSLHLSMKKNEDELKLLAEENSSLRALLKEIEDFETNEARNIQKHAEKLRCARQFGSNSS